MIYHVRTEMRQILAPVVEQARLSLTWSQTSKDRFLMMWLIKAMAQQNLKMARI